MDMLTGDTAEAPAWMQMFAQQQAGAAPAMSQPEMQQQPQAPMPAIAQVPQPELDAVSQAMKTITDAYARQKSGGVEDRVTSILKARSAEKASWADIGQAISTSFGSISVGDNRKFVGVGEALNNLRANKILEAEKLARVQIEDERLNNERDRILIQASTNILTQRGQIANAYKEWLENFKGVVPPETFKEIARVSAEALANRPVSTPEQAYHAFAEAITKIPLPPSMEKTSDERFLSEYVGLRNLQRAGVPLTSDQQDRLDWIGGYRFTKVSPTATGPQIVQPQMQPITPTAAVPGVETKMVPSGPKITRIEMEPTKALPKDAQEDMEAGIRALNSVDVMRRNIGHTGIISGNIERGKIAIGAGEPGAIEFDTAVKNFRVDAQALIKGIPSNFDVETFINTLPALGLPENVNKARIEWHARNTHLLLALKVGYFKHLGYQIPPAVMEIARSYGVDVSDIKSLTREEVLAKTGAMKDEALKATAEDTRSVNGVTYYKIGGKWLKL